MPLFLLRAYSRVLTLLLATLDRLGRRSHVPR
jgi:hypothetical protein